jgi:hypothetical protein
MGDTAPSFKNQLGGFLNGFEDGDYHLKLSFVIMTENCEKMFSNVKWISRT